MFKTTVPSIFCWSRMGAESGEELDTIVRRKEWERQLGEGLFIWGIGQSLGTNALKAAEQFGKLEVLFSPMPSRAKSIDSSPDKIVVWTGWVDTLGRVHSLPKHVLVTSRATLPSGRAKLNHYALLCRSKTTLLRKQSANIHYSHLRNLASDKPLGNSQVTAIVKVDKEAVNNAGRVYPVSFSATLETPYFVQLAQPRLLASSEIEAINRVSALGNCQSWAMLVQQIRDRNDPPEAISDLFGKHSWTGELAIA